MTRETATLHLTEAQLAKRWNKSRRSLQRWRARGVGPPYRKLVHRIDYGLADIEAFERAARITPAGKAENNEGSQ